MLHFVTSYMKQNKSCKQILESAQYGLEISFKVILRSDLRFDASFAYNTIRASKTIQFRERFFLYLCCAFRAVCCAL